MNYRLIRSARKTISIQIAPDGQIIVRAPGRMPKTEIEAFVQSKRSWIESHLPKHPPQPKFTGEQLRGLADLALERIPARVAHYARILGVDYGRITIRSQRTRWGSCSGKGNLNFNCLLMLAPEDVVDYVVVHELCHRKQMNHSPLFWAEVERVLPDYKTRKAWLREHGPALIARLDGQEEAQC